MDSRRVVVVVEETEVSRIALKWALQNLVRYGDLMILLHVFPATKSKKKTRLLRLQAYELALSFKDITNSFPNTKVEIVVAEGDEDGEKIAAMVREIGASTLVLGLHDHSFLYKLAMTHKSVPNVFNCSILAIKQQPTAVSDFTTSHGGEPLPSHPCFSAVDFSLIDIARLQVASVDPPPKIPYTICPDPSAIIWRARARKSSRK